MALQRKAPMKRSTKRINRRSARKIEADRAKPPIREYVFERDGGCLLRGRDDVPACFGPPTPHHLRKEKHGGPYSPENLVCLCSFHNDWVESGSPDHAHSLGLVCRNGETLEGCWITMRENGLVA